MILVCSQSEPANAVWKQTEINKSGTVIICIAYFSVAFFSRVIWFSPNARTFLAFRGERPPSERVPGVRVPAGISVPHWNFCGRLNKHAGTFIRYSRVYNLYHFLARYEKTYNNLLVVNETPLESSFI